MPPIPLVLATVGTDHHPFDRLVGWVDAWAAAQPAGSVECVVQFGSSTPPATATGRAFLPRDELDLLLDRADVIVCHGGPSSIVDARRRGLKPLVVPRQAHLGEHVDDHQVRFTQIMAARRMILPVASAATLGEALTRSLADPGLLRVDPSTLADPAVTANRLGELIDRLLARRSDDPSAA